MARVRGRALVPMRAFIKESFGDLGWKRLLAELAPPHREILDGLIVPDAWYERDLHAATLAAIERLFRAEVPDLGRRLGFREAAHQDRFYLRPLLHIGGARLAIRLAASIFRDYFQGASLSVIEQRSRGARLQLDDPLASRFFCSEILPAVVEAIIQLAGGKPVYVRHEACRHEAAPFCEIDAQWG